MSTSTVDPSTVFIVIPVYNESGVIRDVIQSLKPYNYTVVAIDDGSSDESYAILKSIDWIHTLHHILNLGQGAAIQTGITYALDCGAKFIVTFDSDGQHPANEIGNIVDILAQGDADVVLGSRFLNEASCACVPKIKRIVLKLATFFTRLSCGIDVSDTHNGFRGFTASAARHIHITQNRMSHASQILSQIARSGLKYAEYPVTICYTEYSMAKGQKISNSLNILWDSLFSK
ncbi:MAG: glycosyltransferase family 2 protein [Acidobacteriota bacterium]